jgi:hypothetical protein
MPAILVLRGAGSGPKRAIRPLAVFATFTRPQGEGRLTAEVFMMVNLVSLAVIAVLSARSSDSMTINVAGSGVDLLNTAIVHSTRATATGKIQRSTETVELTGDLRGRVLYHVTSVFDFVNGTLVNSGDQVYSGTIAGSAPVLIHDDQFRFEVNLQTGSESGKVYLFNHLAGEKVRCVLDVTGTGLSPEGNPTFTYAGSCTMRGR